MAAAFMLLLTGFMAPSQAADETAGGDEYTLPVKPDASALGSAFPKCETMNSVSGIQRCRQDLELYRETTLEDYNSDLQQYIAELKQLDGRLELARAQGKISSGRYSELHEKIKTELSKSSEHDGRYVRTYLAYAHKYRDEQRVARNAYDTCVLTACG
jgi:hypothetical protein